MIGALHIIGLNMLEIKKIEDNDIISAINLMNDFIFDPPPVGFERNEAAWTSNFLGLHYKSKQNTEALILGAFDSEDGELIGFISGDCFISMYDGTLTADMKDTVTFPREDHPQGLVFSLLFDAFLRHYYDNGIVTWRFDTIRKGEDQSKVEKYITEHYAETNDIDTFVSIRGHQLEK